MLSKEIIDKRQEMVRHLHYTGIKIPLILQRLSDHLSLFPPAADYDERFCIIASDVATINKQAMDDIAIDEFDFKQQHASYIDRQKFLYNQALQDGNLALAGNFSKDIARAYGVQTDEAIVVKGDFLSIMKGAKEQALRKLADRKVIDVTPETMPIEIVKPAADAIFHKR